MIYAATEGHRVAISTSIIPAASGLGNVLYSMAGCECGKMAPISGSDEECKAWAEAHVREVETAREESRLRREAYVGGRPFPTHATPPVVIER